MVYSRSSCPIIWCMIVFLGCLDFRLSAGHTTTKCQDDMRLFDRSTKQFVHWLQGDTVPDGPMVPRSTILCSPAPKTRVVVNVCLIKCGTLNVNMIISEIVKEVISNWNNKTANVKSKVVYYELPFLAVTGVILFSAFATSVTGFGIIFYKKFKTTKRDDRSIDRDETVDARTRSYVFLLAVVSCFLILTDVSLFISNNHLSEGLPHARKTLISSFDDLQHFQNSTIQELDDILRDDFDRAVGASLDQLRALADCSAGGLDSILRNRKVHFNKASESAVSALHTTREMLSHINITLGKLQGLSNDLKSELGKLNLYFKEAKRICFSSQHLIAGDVCKKFVSEKDVFSPPQLQLQVLNNVTEIHSRIVNFLNHLNFSPIYEVLTSQEGIERHLCEERSVKLKELENLCNGIRFARNFTLDTVKSYSSQLTEHSLIPMKSKVGRVLGTDGNIGRYDRKRWWLSFVIFLAVFVASLMTLLGLFFKQVEPFISRIPSSITRTVELKAWFPWLPKQLLFSSTIVHLSVAVIVNMCAAIAFLVLSNMALVCEMSTDYEKLDNVFGTSDLLKESKLFAKEKKSLKLFKKISDCPEDGTLWVMFDLDGKFDVNDSMNQLNGIPRIAARLFQDSSIFDRRKEKHLREFYKILQEWRSVGLESINIDTVAEQVNNPILDKSFQKLSEALLLSYQQDENKNAAENVTRSPFKMFRSISNKANVVEENYIKMYTVLSKLLNQHLQYFNNSREKVIASFSNMSDIYSDIVADGITRDEHEVVDRQVINTVRVIKEFMKDSISKVRSEVGKCGPVKQAYNQTVCLFCRDLFGSWNSWWILLLVCGFLTILSVILCFLTLKQTS